MVRPHDRHRHKSQKLGDEFGGALEVDQAYIGGDPKNMHSDVRKSCGIRRGRGTHKTAVAGMLERGGEVRTQVIFKPNARTPHGFVHKQAVQGSTLYTDAWQGYAGLKTSYQHFVIDHAKAHVEGLIHTNGMENSWSLLKRTIKGMYVSVEPFHLHAYLGEQAFRYNQRKGTEGERLHSVKKGVSGKRFTYKRLTGKELFQPCA